MPNSSLALFILGTAFLNRVYSQEAFVAGSSNLLAGFGFQNWEANQKLEELENEVKYYNEYTGAYAYTYSSAKNTRGPFFLRYEYAKNKHIGLGLVLGYSDFQISANNNYSVIPAWSLQEETHTYRIEEEFVSYTIGFRFNYHFFQDKRLDPYAGIALGYTYSKMTTRIESTQFQSTSPYPREYNETGIPLYMAISLGIRFYLVNFLALYAEVGADKYSFAQVGLVYKFAK